MVAQKVYWKAGQSAESSEIQSAAWSVRTTVDVMAVLSADKKVVLMADKKVVV